MKDNSSYTHPSLKSDGFIHCSTRGQIPLVLNRFFANELNLIVLEIITSQLTSKVIYEVADGDKYPHIYGEINSNAIKRTHALKRIEGKFVIDF